MTAAAQGGWYNRQWSYGKVKRRFEVIYLPQREKVEGTNFLSHALLSGRAEWVGMITEMFLEPWT